MQLNTPVVTEAFKGITWYPFLVSTSGRGASLEPEGGSWASFKATEMKISTYMDIRNLHTNFTFNLYYLSLPKKVFKKYKDKIAWLPIPLLYNTCL